MEKAAESVKLHHRKRFQSKLRHKHSIQYIKSVAANKINIFIGIMFISGAFGKGGKLLFEEESDRLKDEAFQMTPLIDLTPLCDAFEDIKMYFPQAFSDVTKADPKSKEYDPCYMLSALISDFHHDRQKKVTALVNRWIAKHFFYFVKPRTLGTEFKSVARSSTGMMLFL